MPQESLLFLQCIEFFGTVNCTRPASFLSLLPEFEPFLVTSTILIVHCVVFSFKEKIVIYYDLKFIHVRLFIFQKITSIEFKPNLL